MKADLRPWLIRHVPTGLHPTLRTLQHGAALAAGQVLRRLPGSSRRFGPPRGLAPTLAGYVTRRREAGGGAVYRELLGSETVRRLPPRSLDGELPLEFRQEMSRVFPPVGAALIEHGRVLTRTGTVIGPEDQLIADVSSTFMAAAYPIFMTAKLPPVTTVKGAVAVLTTYRSNIYYHWLFDTLPRLQLVHQSGLPCDKIVVPGRSRFQRESLELLGIDRRRLIIDPGLHLEAEALVVPTLPGVSGNPPRWACDFLRKSFLKYLPDEAPERKRIYVSRRKSGTRRLVNEPEVLALLEKRGFECVVLEELSFLDQIRLFDAAEIVVGTHGSGLANLVFCRPGAAVVELFSPNYINVMYWALSNQIGLAYYFSKGVGDVSRQRGRRVHEDILVDVPQLAMLLKRVEEDLRQAWRSTASVG